MTKNRKKKTAKGYKDIDLMSPRKAMAMGYHMGGSITGPSQSPGGQRPMQAPFMQRPTMRGPGGVNPSMQRPMQRPMQGPTQRPTQRPMQRPMQRPTQRPMQRPMQRPTQRPMQRPTQRPMRGPTQRPMQRPTGRRGFSGLGAALGRFGAR